MTLSREIIIRTRQPAKDRDDWCPAGICPKCGSYTLYQHKRWTDGTSSETPYARCFTCNQGYFLAELRPDLDYYGGILAEEGAP